MVIVVLSVWNIIFDILKLDVNIDSTLNYHSNSSELSIFSWTRIKEKELKSHFTQYELLSMKQYTGDIIINHTPTSLIG